MPQMIRGLSRQEARRRAADLLGYLGLKERLTHRPAELSGGEQQRVAIARAVANAPRILLADEPTGNLDPRTADHVFAALTQLVQASGLAAVVATHNMDIAARMDRRVTIEDGLVVELDLRPEQTARRRQLQRVVPQWQQDGTCATRVSMPRQSREMCGISLHTSPTRQGPWSWCASGSLCAKGSRPKLLPRRPPTNCSIEE